MLIHILIKVKLKKAKMSYFTMLNIKGEKSFR